MVFLCLVSALLSYNVKTIIKNWKDTKAKAVGNTIELKIKKKAQNHQKQEHRWFFYVF